MKYSLKPETLTGLFIAVAAAIFLGASSVSAGPPPEFNAYFDPVDTMLAPCMEKGEACINEGLNRDECEGVVEACLSKLDNKAREERYASNTDNVAKDSGIPGGACEDIIKECFEETKDMDSCIVGVLRCSDDGAPEPYPCCPGRCVKDYKGLVNDNAPVIDVFLTVFVSAKTACFKETPH